MNIFTGGNLNCAFVSYISRWFKNNSKAKINYINKSWPGYSSEMTSLNVLDLLTDRKPLVPHFTANDIIFLDHSITDHTIPSERLFHVMTTFLNKIYAYAVSPSDFPTIILLEMEPRKVIFKSTNYSVNLNYESIAKLYGIPFWSYRNAVNNGKYVQTLIFHLLTLSV